MTQLKPLDLNWLVNDSCRHKAHIKYEIKQMEGSFKCFFSNGDELISVDEQVISLCAALSRHYRDYLNEICPCTDHDLLEDTFEVTSSTWRDCYTQIESLKSQLMGVLTREEEILRVGALQKHYQRLSDLLAQYEFGSTQTADDMDWSVAIKPLLQANSPPEWLDAVVHLANQQTGINFNHDLIQLAHLTKQQLMRLSHAFSQPEFMDIIRAIFFYKLYPQTLFNQVLHPEKLVSVKVRLSLLYDFIESLHQTLIHALKQRGLPVIQDYLFHGEELPQGIEIAIGEDSSNFIISAIKSWRMTAPMNDNKLSALQLKDIFRAYKFWFNPDRLIDAVMVLRQRLVKDEQCLTAEGEFYQKMLSLFRQLTTTECLDLYGYFANKDTCYLMRTLLALKRGVELSGLPIVNADEKNVIKRVYAALESVMNALRDEMAARHINTEPYKRNVVHKKLVPGRRNRNALNRMIRLYAGKKEKPNTRI